MENNSEIINSISDIYVAVFGKHRPSVNDEIFLNSEVNSIEMMEFVQKMNEFFSKQISVSLLFELTTIEKIGNYLFEEDELDQVQKVTAIDSSNDITNEIDKQQYLFTTPHEEEKEQNNTDYSLISKSFGVKSDSKSLKKKEAVSLVMPQMKAKKKLNFNEVRSKTASVNDADVAVIAMSGKFPKASDVNEFWENIENTKVSIDYPKTKRKELFMSTGVGYPDHIQGAFLKDISLFDAKYFDITEEEALFMDPQQRLLLEETERCLLNAGLSAKEIAGENIGVYVSSMGNEYKNIIALSSHKYSGLAIPGNDQAMLANRLSYHYDLKGESLVINTACSSSFVSLNLAMEAIRVGKVSGAIVAAVNLILDPTETRKAENLGLLSTENIIRSFQSQSLGYIRGEGVGVVYLKKLSKAITDKDNILGVLKGGAVTHNGKSHYIMGANPLAQANSISKALTDSGLSIDQIDYIEGHGTGLKAGDESELYAYSKLIESSDDVEKIYLGTLKPNIGHLEAASGIASLIKILLGIRNKKIPPMALETATENSFLDFNSKLVLLTSDKGFYPPKKTGFVAALHSYGLGGTNASILLEEFSEAEMDSTEQRASLDDLFVFSAKSQEGLRRNIEKLQDFLKKNPTLSPRELSRTLRKFRSSLNERVAFRASGISELSKLLAIFLASKKDDDIFISTSTSRKLVNQLISEKDMLNETDLNKIAIIWVNGGKISLKKDWWSASERYISLPEFQFTEKEYWVETALKVSDSHKLIQNKLKTRQEKNNDEIIKEIFAEILEQSSEDLSEETSLQMLELNSISLLRLKYQIHERLKVDLKLTDLAKASAIKDILQLLETKNDFEACSDEELVELFENLGENKNG